MTEWRRSSVSVSIVPTSPDQEFIFCPISTLRPLTENQAEQPTVSQHQHRLKKTSKNEIAPIKTKRQFPENIRKKKHLSEDINASQRRHIENANLLVEDQWIYADVSGLNTTSAEERQDCHVRPGSHSTQHVCDTLITLMISPLHYTEPTHIYSYV